jgi:hypothetical protein
MASFYGLRLRNHKKYLFLNEEHGKIQFSDLFYLDSFSDVEFKIVNSTDPSAVLFNVEGDNIRVQKGDRLGETELTIRAKIPDKDIWIDTKLTIYNYSDYLIDNFERMHLEDSSFSWISENDNSWQITNNHYFSEQQSLRSGRISYGETTRVSFNTELEYGGTISFAYKTDTYVNSFNDFNDGSFLNFYINDRNLSFDESPELWGGINNWRVVSYQLPPGNSNLEWEYSKKHWGSTEEDGVWIDNVILQKHFALEKSGTKYSHNLNIHPNPFNPETEISFTLNKPEYVRLSIFDIKGREVIGIVDGEMSSGKHSLAVSLSKLSGGTYFTVFRTQKTTLVNKILYLK